VKLSQISLVLAVPLLPLALPQCANTVADPRPASDPPPGSVVRQAGANADVAAAPDERCANHAPKPGGSDPDEGAVFEVGVTGAPVRGRTDAPVTIVYFSDFECPYCAKGEATLREVEAALPGKVKVAFRQRPLPFHAHARLAARASIAAERQGRFWPYHDILVKHGDALERADLERYATEAGLDLARFARDLDDPETDARVAADEKDADALGVKGTPTAFINGRRLVGAEPLPAWLAAIERTLPKN
jgi:protein-disulfide isomerase